jgi:pimeloyl-ACP methyl ester carboxylesterase
MDTTRIGDIVIRYATNGSGAPLVLLHGFTDQIESWSEMGYVKALTEAGRRLVLIDQRGHGGSSRPHEVDAYRPEARAADVVAVLDALGIARADVLGYSMGGWAALNLARYHPTRIDRLIVGGCHPFGQSMAFYREAMDAGLDRWIDLVEHLAETMPEAWKERVRRNDIDALRAAVAEDRPDISAALADFARPCLFYAGGDDPLYGALGRCASFFADARFLEVRGRNHLTALTDADLVLPELITFLGTDLSNSRQPPSAASAPR